MLSVNNLSLQFGKRVLFEEVSLKFTKGNCYGVIGANGAGKSTFLKILSKEIDPTSGSVILETNKRMSVLEQNHNKFDEKEILETVILGNSKLIEIKDKMDAIYAKPDFSEEDGIKAGELGSIYEEMGGWNAESDAAGLLSSLGILEDLHTKKMAEITGSEKVKVLLAQALFGNPDVLILDEPTNDLDIDTIVWLENFLADYENTVIVVSHDRHFLDSVCTNIVDIDFKKINSFTGNYAFWYESSQIIAKQKAQANKKAEDKKKELQSFIERFSANASKSKQATSRKKLLEKINIDDMPFSSRRYPAIFFEKVRDLGNQVLEVKDLEYTLEGETLFKNINLNIQKGDKVALLSKNSLATTAFYQLITNEAPLTSGEINWGITASFSYLPNDNAHFFTKDLVLVDWLRQYTQNDEEKDEVFIRGFLGRMLFTKDEALKSCKVLSGGEKVRCVLSKMMLQRANVVLLDEPTNHLDMESITAFNNALLKFDSNIFITSHDHEFLQSVANRVIELTPQGAIDRKCTYDEYITDPKIKELREKMYED